MTRQIEIAAADCKLRALRRLQAQPLFGAERAAMERRASLLLPALQASAQAQMSALIRANFLRQSRGRYG